MELQFRPVYFVYIMTDQQRIMLEVGSTNDLEALLAERNADRRGEIMGAGNCSDLLYWEPFRDPYEVVKRETELLRISGRKKRMLIRRFNPAWAALNKRFLEHIKPAC